MTLLLANEERNSDAWWSVRRLPQKRPLSLDPACPQVRQKVSQLRSPKLLEALGHKRFTRRDKAVDEESITRQFSQFFYLVILNFLFVCR